MTTNTNSVGNSVGVREWLVENISFLQMRLHGLRTKAKELESLVAELEGYATIFKKYADGNLKKASLFEVGYGARPLRLLTLIALGYNARGIDLDQPTLYGGTAELFKVLRKNGLARFLKTLVRTILFDAHERRNLTRILALHGVNELKIHPERFLVGDAAKLVLPEKSIDFLYSEDVFEHLPVGAIHSVCSNMSRALSDRGIAVITPLVHTGLAGGHLVEWYPHRLKDNFNRRSEPWEHLRKRRFVADCYLNELRLNDYLILFQKYFKLLAVENLNAGRGRTYLNPEIKRELSDYSEEELLSDRWRFILARKTIDL